MNHQDISAGLLLVVDDDPAMRNLLAKILEATGNEIITAGSGEEALRVAAESSPDAILLDYLMPEMDGLETCIRLRECQVCANIPILIITGVDDRDALVRILSSGATDYIGKPFQRRDVMIRVKNAVHLSHLQKELDLEAQRMEEIQARLEGKVRKLTMDLTRLSGLSGDTEALARAERALQDLAQLDGEDDDDSINLDPVLPS